jgi:transposase
MGSNSMARCAEWLSDPNVRGEFGITGKVSQKTINRALEIIGKNAGRFINRLWKGLNDRYRFEDTDVNIDGSAVVFNGPRSEMAEIGYPRDFKDQSRPQVEFITAQLQRSKIPFYIRPFNGNVSDAEQYRTVLPELFSMIQRGSWIIMDNGGAAGDVLDSIVGSGNKYVTRVRTNESDDIRMSLETDKWEYVEEGVCCLKHTFDRSDRTIYVYWSVDNWLRAYEAAKRKARRMIDAVISYENGKIRKSDFVTVRKNVLADVDVKVRIQTQFDYNNPREFDLIVEQAMRSRPGIFKLESSHQLTPSEALDKYRARASVEHLIHSLKRITGLKPLRVWKRDSIHGSMILALLSEAAIAMARYELEPKTKVILKNGKRVVENSKPSTGSMVWSLGHLTVCRLVDNGKRKGAIYSNWNHISSAVFSNIRSNSHKNGAIKGG